MKIKKYFQDYLVVNRHTADFDQKFASIGSDPAREILLVDPHSALLIQMYQTFLKKIRQHKMVSPLEIIASLMKHLHEPFLVPEHLKPFRPTIESINEEWIARGNQFVIKNDKKEKVPVVPIDHYVLQKRFACRHYAALTGVFICKSIKDGLFAGKVRQHRDKTPIGPHAWIMFIDPSNQLYIVDTTLWETPYKLVDFKQKLLPHYGETAFEHMETRYEALKALTFAPVRS